MKFYKSAADLCHDNKRAGERYDHQKAAVPFQLMSLAANKKKDTGTLAVKRPASFCINFK
ncbi:hypothetical protein [Agathobaculum sp. TL06]